MIRTDEEDKIIYDFENGEFVFIYPDQTGGAGVWVYNDALYPVSRDCMNLGTYVIDTNARKAFLVFSAYKIESAVIHAFRDFAGAVEWNDPKPKPKRRKR